MSEQKCARCGADEFRLDGYCSVYCEDMHEAEQEIAALKLENKRLRDGLGGLRVMLRMADAMRNNDIPPTLKPAIVQIEALLGTSDV